MDFGLGADDMERMKFFEMARQQAEDDYNKNNKDVQALTRWGGALLELASFRQGSQAEDMIDEAEQKLKMALEIDPQRADTLWCLGNSYVSKGFVNSDESEAIELFDKAKDVFQKAKDIEPENEAYNKAVEMTARAPEIWHEVQAHMKQMESGSRGGGKGGKKGGDKKSKQSGLSDWYWDAMGWVCLVSIIVGLGYLGRNYQPPQLMPPNLPQ
eukprot:TRINITY_DN2159_c0_g1_i1.p2 TRINITY_DN2159_c0_g1~~TRINITY_DN2159_c0_g1_i1.p2  ORF type:complete len:213 (+),score=49.57 TRINITY_DN2159_c0_g1_i1:215-853(+)